MANKINVKLILELRDANMSRNGIASAKRFSKNSVSDVFHIADSMGITYEAIRDLGEETVYRMFYPDKHAVERIFKEPDYERVHGELRKNGVTLKLLWEEYRDGLREENAVPVGYAKFCRGYREYTIANSVTSHIEHRPGAAVEVDWSGSTMSCVDGVTGENIKVYLFVATLPYSQYSYVEPCIDMKQPAWLACHINMYEFFGGSPQRTVCDYAAESVIRQAYGKAVRLPLFSEKCGIIFASHVYSYYTRERLNIPTAFCGRTEETSITDSRLWKIQMLVSIKQYERMW